MVSTTTPPNLFQILSLDGGGLKGMFSAAVLAKLEEKCHTTILNHFDLIAGTSTGGIIALGLGMGLTPREILEFYVRQGRRIFINRAHWRSILQWFWRKYPAKRLENALKTEPPLANKSLSQSRTRLLIPTYNLHQDAVRVFKTPHHPRLTTDGHIPAWQVALATSAAPTYFPACRSIKDMRLIDGGVWANNPALLAITEAISLLGQPLENIRMLSIGTTYAKEHRSKALDFGGRLNWAPKISDILTHAQSVGTDGVAGHLIGQDRLSRINPVVPKGIHRIDKVNVDVLLGQAEQTALRNAPTFTEQFVPHIASPWTPEPTQFQESYS